MKIDVINADALTVSTGRSGVRPTGVPLGPVIILIFKPGMAQSVVDRLLRRFAHPVDIVAGYYRHADGKMSFGCYLVVTVPPPHNTTYAVGNIRDMGEAEWESFNERLGEFGQFSVSCGAVHDVPGQVQLTVPPWFLTTSTFHHDDIYPRMVDIMMTRL